MLSGAAVSYIYFEYLNTTNGAMKNKGRLSFIEKLVTVLLWPSVIFHFWWESKTNPEKWSERVKFIFIGLCMYCVFFYLGDKGLI